MWEFDYKESWVPKNWCFWSVVLEKTLESPLDCKEIQQVDPKGNQSWIFIERTDAETPNTLATSWEELTDWKRSWCQERLKAGGEVGNRRWWWLDSITDLMDMNLSKLWEIVEDRGAWHGVTKSQTQLSNWTPKNWWFQSVVLEKTLESPLDGKEINPVNPKESQPWIFIGRTDAEAEAPIPSATWCEELTY